MIVAPSTSQDDPREFNDLREALRSRAALATHAGIMLSDLVALVEKQPTQATWMRVGRATDG